MSSHSEQQKRLSGFFASEYQNLLSYVKRYFVGDEETDPEDILQDVALNLFTKVDFTTPIENLLAYTYRSLKNKVIDRQRKRKDKLLSEFEDEKNGKNSLLEKLKEDEEEITPGIDDKEILKMLGMMENLNPEHREIIIQTELEGYTFEELSREWGIPIGTLLSRKHRGMAKLQKLMKEK